MESDYITSDELNNIILRYLTESGFGTAAFNFRHEANLNRSRVDYNVIPQGTLVHLVQLGLQYTELLANNVPGANEDNFCFLPTMDLIMKNPSELQEIVKDKIRNEDVAVGNKQKGGGSCNVKDIMARKDDEKPDKDKERMGLFGRIAKRPRTPRVVLSGPSVSSR